MTDPTPHHRSAHRRAVRSTAVAVLGVAALAGCGSSSSSSTSSTATDKGKPAANGTPAATVAPPKTVRPASSSYNPKIDPKSFSATIDNPYFTLTPGMVRIAKGIKDGVPQTHTLKVTNATKMIAGVRTRVIHDDVTTTGGQLVEKVFDWYAQDRKGNVWYFGESTADYEKGVVVSTKGSWETGIDGAKPGIVMPAHPKPGPAFYSEFRPGVAEDRAKVLSVGEKLKIPFGTFTNVVRIRDSNPLDPSIVSNKWYAKGTGLLRTTRVGSSHHEFSNLVTLKR
jgi:hypothetical protein